MLSRGAGLRRADGYVGPAHSRPEADFPVARQTLPQPHVRRRKCRIAVLTAFHCVHQAHPGVGWDRETELHHTGTQLLVWMRAFNNGPLAAISFHRLANKRGDGSGAVVGNDCLHLSHQFVSVWSGRVRDRFAVDNATGPLEQVGAALSEAEISGNWRQRDLILADDLRDPIILRIDCDHAARQG